MEEILVESGAKAEYDMMTDADIGIGRNIFFVSGDPYMVFGIIMACAFAGLVTGYVLLDVLIPKKPKVVESDEAKRIREYEAGYVNELEALEDVVLDRADLLKLADVNVDTETPYGKVIMTYDIDSEAYFYYANSKSVPYKTLDAVARQFAVAHNCKHICVNYKEEWEKAKAAAIAEEEADVQKQKEEEAEEKKKRDSKKKGDSKKQDYGTDTPPVVKRDVFAKLKKYNHVEVKSSNQIQKSTNSNEASHNNKQRKDSIKRRRYRIMTERANRFTHKGRLSDYVDPTLPKCDSKPVLSFADFKANMKKENQKESN